MTPDQCSTAVETNASPVLAAALASQPRALALLSGSVEAPVHAYLILGAPGTGKRAAALAFATALVCPHGGCGRCPACRDASSGTHPDVAFVERTGASILVEQARAVVALAQRGPAVARRQVIVLTDFHLVGQAAPILLKTLEEPPVSTVLVVLADYVSPPLVTIASRCVVVDLVALDLDALTQTLVDEGVPDAVAQRAASSAGGRLDRARLLARDPGFAARQNRWTAIPSRFDGTGATLAVLVDELLGSADELVDVVRARQAEEIAAAEAYETTAERSAAGRHATEERHKREQRRVRVDEMRSGLAALAGVYRSKLADGPRPARQERALVDAITAVDAAAGALTRNPSELLLLQALLLEIEERS